MDFSAMSDALLGGGAGGGAVGTFIFYAVKNYLKTLTAENIELRKDIKDLKDNKIQKIEQTLDSHIKTETSAQIVTAQLGTRLDFISGNIEKFSDSQEMTNSKLAKIESTLASTSASQAAQIIANEKYISNLDASFQKHKEIQHAK